MIENYIEIEMEVNGKETKFEINTESLTTLLLETSEKTFLTPLTDFENKSSWLE